jgi:Secretion system C-terminal sorting domain
MKARKISQMLFLSVALFSVQHAVAQINRDLPGPAANIVSMPAGSLVIAMDNTNQNGPGSFNLKSYGLVVTLMNNFKFLRWVITAGKAHNGADFTVNAEQLFPTSTAASSRTFSAGPFVIFRSDTAGCAAIINTFNNAQPAANRVKVYRTTASVNVDVRYNMNGIRPKAAILNDGGNAAIHTAFMQAASVPTSNYAVVSTAANLSANCYTFASEPHNDAVSNSVIDGIRQFVASNGGNFLAQCEAIPTYENHPSGRFQSSNGIVDGANPSINTNIVYSNADLSMAQFEGNYNANQEGAHQTWRRSSGSNAANNFYSVVVGNSAATSDVSGATVSKLKPSGTLGGLVFYLGNHKFTGSNIEDVNGTRMYLNAFLTPAAYPACPESGPLAAKIIAFAAKKTNNNQQVQLLWTTAQELNATVFVIEKSVNGIDFVELSRIPASGNSNIELNYSAIDNSPVTGKNFYRLVEVDRAGVMTYSSVVVIHFGAIKNALEVFPNPSMDFINIRLYDLPLQNNTVTVTDMQGKQVVAGSRISGNNIILDVRNLNSGSYFVKITTESGVVAQSKFIIAPK